MKRHQRHQTVAFRDDVSIFFFALLYKYKRVLICSLQASSAFAIFRATISVSPALESDLEPLHSLQRLQLRSAGFLPSTSMESPISANGFPSTRGGVIATGPLFPPHTMQSPRSHFSGLSSSGFTLSSNPPNPRNVFRLGDWMCPSTSCAAHNFGRNFSCIGCGCPRPSTAHAPSSKTHYLPLSNPTQVPSPRFVAALEPQMPASPSQRVPHVLTPSGRAFSVGGRVQDVSSDPLSPCVIFWPDNEPFPEQKQIRPNDLVGIPHPPILNTGNRGPIEHQPGDWVCRKCNYLNWRRRKVCQTCYPYAEGNGDSIPAAVQADRIKRLREALSVTLPPSLSNLQTASLDILPRSPVAHIQRSHCRYIDSHGSRTMCSPALKSRDQIRSSVELGFHSKDTIYQTSTAPVSLSYSEPALLPLDNGSGPFLPSCLQDIVQSPSLSPTSTVSADLSVDEYVASPASAYSTISAKHHPNNERPLHVRRTTSSVSLGLGNIWQLDGEESKALSGSLTYPNEVPRI
ncbi:hypothetical protein H4582DRAFT_663016 [Lactarius indigo]|nr:hypothetical protein H4582DRAFT_663016 [Lactarius indigo]